MKRLIVTLFFVLSLSSMAFGQQYLTSITLPGPVGNPAVIPGAISVAAARNVVYVLAGVGPSFNASLVNTCQLYVIDGATDSIVTSISIPFNCGGVLYNPVTDKVYVGTFQGGIQVIDASTNTIVNVISTVPESADLAVNTSTNTIYAADWRASRIHIIDGATDTRTGQITLPSDSIFPRSMVVNPTTNRIYMTYGSGSIFPFVIIDGNSNTVVSRDFTELYAGLEIDLVNNRVYAIRLGGGVGVFDLSTETFLSYNVPTGGSQQVGGMAYNTTTDRLHLSRISSSSAPLDTMKPQDFSISTLNIPGAVSIFSVSVNPLANKIYVAQRDTFTGNNTVGKIHVLLDATLVQIDIKPGSFPNSINLGSNGTVAVAILSTATFNATTVDPLSVTLASAPVKLKGKGTPMSSNQDVNQDGRTDLVVHVDTSALQLSTSDSQALLEGQTFSGTPIQGSDSVRVVPE